MPTCAPVSRYVIRHARPADIPAIRVMQERSMWVLGGDFYTSSEIASFLTLFEPLPAMTNHVAVAPDSTVRHRRKGI